MTGPLAAPFLQALTEGRLFLQRCSTCARHRLPPTVRCGACGSQQWTMVPASGRGRLASFAVLHRAPGPEHQARVPYVYALVDLDEGPRIVTNVVHADPGALRIGQVVTAVFERTDDDGRAWPDFEPG